MVCVYIYNIYIHLCVCVCVCVYLFLLGGDVWLNRKEWQADLLLAGWSTISDKYRLKCRLADFRLRKSARRAVALLIYWVIPMMVVAHNFYALTIHELA